MTESISQFIRGATRPSLPALLGTVIVAIAWCVVAAGRLTPAAVAEHGAAVLEIGGDRTRATGAVVRLRQEEPGPLTVLLLGTSALREAVTEVDDLAHRLSRRGMGPVRVLDLTLNAANVWEIAELAHGLPAGSRAVFIIGMNPARLGHSRDEHAADVRLERFAFDTDVIDEEMRRAGMEPPARTGMFVLDHLPFLAVCRHDLIRLVLGHRPQSRHRWMVEQPMTLDCLLARAAPIRQALAGYDANVEPNLDVLARLVARERRRSRIEVLIAEAPRNPGLDGPVFSPALLARHRDRLFRFAREVGVEYRDVARDADLRPEEFADHYHLRVAAAMERYTAALERAVAPVLSRLVGAGR